MSDNISGAQVKQEIINTRPRGDECKAVIAGFVRSCMTLSRSDGDFMLQLDCQTDYVKEYIYGAMLTMFKIRPKETSPALMYDDCERLLRLLGIIEPDGDVFEILPIGVMSDDTESAYVRGVFLACGSFSVRGGGDGQKGGGGYHLEFSVLSESFADELIELLSRREITAHKMERADKSVVYVKGVDNVSNCLALMRLSRLVIKLNDTAAMLSIKRDVNRRMNCDMANMTRVANASVDVIAAIEYIERHGGLTCLPPKLVEAADARINSPDAPLGEIAFELGISKSGLKHRFDKIIEKAKDMGFGEEV